MARSIKLHTPETKKRAIAHFYRPCTIYPYIEPGFVFNSTAGAAEVHTEQGLGWSLSGDKGQVQVSLKLPRPNWIAGQQCWLDITVNNKSSRKIKTMTLALLRTVILFSPPANNSRQAVASPDLAKYSGKSNRKKLFEHTIEASAGPGSGYVGSTGWWTGVQPGERIRWQSSLALPAECLTIVRSRLIDVSYTIRLTLNGSVHLDVPVVILNYQSIDPPPTCAFSAGLPRSYDLPLEQDEAAEVDSYPMQMDMPNNARRMVNSGPAAYSQYPQEDYSDVDVHHPPRPPHFPLGPPMRMPETPADRRRPLSTDSGMHTYGSKVSFVPTLPPLPGQSGSQRSRPNSMYSMGRAQTAPMLMRPGATRRDTTLSYLSAVASMEEGDLHQVEARRRAGRQASLAAIMFGRDNDDQEIMIEEDVNVTPSTGTFAPQTAPQSLEGSPEDDPELSEAQQDLDFVKATSTPEVNGQYGFHSPAQVSADPSSRDSESRFLEEDLEDQHAYRSRFDDQADDRSASVPSAIMRSPLHQDTTQSAMSHSVYDDSEEGEDEAFGDKQTTLSTRSLEKHNQAQPMLMPMSDRSRQAHIGATRSMYGSFAASAVSVASGPESEIGQVVEAIRRNLTMRNSPSRGESPGGEARSVDTLPEVLPNLRRYLDVPRSNSLGVMPDTLDVAARRPSAPAINTRRPSNWSSISPTSRTSGAEPYGGVWLNSPYRQQTGPIGAGSIERSISPLRQQAVPVPLALDPEEAVNIHQATRSSSFDAPRPPSLAPPIENYEPAPGLAPSVASDSASSHSHEDERATTPTGNRPNPLGRDSNGPLTPTYETAGDSIEVRIWRDSNSSATTSNPRNSLRSPKRLRIPSGPREKPSISPKSPYRPRYASTAEEPMPQNPERLTVTIPEVPTPAGSPQKSITGSGRFARSPVNMSPRSPSRYQEYNAARSPGKGHTDASRRASPMDLSAKQLERQGSQASVRSTSTTATQLETMLLERKGSSYVFEHSKYMQDWTGYHKAAAPYRTNGLEGDDEESLSLL